MNCIQCKQHINNGKCISKKYCDDCYYLLSKHHCQNNYRKRKNLPEIPLDLYYCKLLSKGAISIQYFEHLINNYENYLKNFKYLKNYTNEDSL